MNPLSTHGHVVGMVYLDEVIELIKSHLDPEKLAKDLGAAVGEMLHQRLEVIIKELEETLTGQIKELLKDLSIRVRI